MITSQITGVRIFGQNPAGFVPLVPQNNAGNGYFATLTKEVEFNYLDLTFDPAGQIPTTKDNFLVMVKDFMDNNYLPTILTDPAIDYEVEISVNSVKLDFIPAIVGVTDRSIWSQRSYKWFVGVTCKVNVV